MDEEQDIGQALIDAERALEALKERYIQVSADQQRLQDAQQELRRAQQQENQRSSPALRADIKHLKTQIDELELALESRLFSWRGLKESFWQAVRFGLLGVVVGWLLKSCTN
jgi:hypothetical protein